MTTASEIAEALPTDVVLFLGAGASKAVGLPVMNEFFEKLLHDKAFATNVKKTCKYVLHPSTSAEERANKRSLIYFLARAAYLDQDHPHVYDLERILSFVSPLEPLLEEPTLETARRFFFLADRCMKESAESSDKFHASFGGRGEEVGRLLGEIKQSISQIRKGVYNVFGGGYDKNTSVKAAKVYLPLLDLLSRYSRSIPVFTTNYDSVVEGMAYYPDLMSWQLFDGSFDMRGAHQWALSDYTKHINEQQSLFYFKLHGSLSWKRDADGNIVKRPLTESFPKRPVILYPVEPSKVLTEEPFVGLYEVFERLMERAKRCIVIGFSFRDERLREIFRRALEKRNAFRLVIVSPPAADSEKYIDEHISQMVKDFGPERVCRIAGKFGEEETWHDLVAALQQQGQ